MLLAAEASSTQSLIMTFLPFLLIGLVIFFMMRQRKRVMAQTDAMLAALRPGIKIMLTSGIKGTVKSIGDDDFELEIAPGVVITVVKGAVGKVESDEQHDASASARTDVDERPAADS